MNRNIVDESRGELHVTVTCAGHIIRDYARPALPRQWHGTYSALLKENCVSTRSEETGNKSEIKERNE
jgi:hypothetical protein